MTLWKRYSYAHRLCILWSRSLTLCEYRIMCTQYTYLVNLIVLFIRMPEYREGAVVEQVEVLAVGDSRYGVVVPLEEARVHGRMEPGEHLVLRYAVNVRPVRVRAGRGARVAGRTGHVAVVAIL